MREIIYCQILSVIILVMLLTTLVIKERGYRKLSLFVPSIILALLHIAFSVYAGAVNTEELTNGEQPAFAEIKPVIDLFINLLESFSLAFFCLFLKRELFKGSRLNDRLLTALSFIGVPLTVAAAFLPPYWNAYPLFFLFQTVLIGLFIAFSSAERNVRVWFMVAGAIYALSCVILIVYPSAKTDGVGLTLMYLTVFIGYEAQMKNDILSRELELSNAKTMLLTHQISPHFIFNTLQVMIGLCDNEPEKTKPALIHFSEYLRGNLESITTDRLIPFTKELDHTKEYLALEQYGDGREFEVDYRLQTTQFMVPPLVLQPIVENAVRYGIGARSKGGRIVIETRETPFMTLIRVIDDGAGKNTMTAQQKNRQSVGMKNVRERLSALCGGELILESDDSGTTVTITIPKTQE